MFKRCLAISLTIHILAIFGAGFFLPRAATRSEPLIIELVTEPTVLIEEKISTKTESLFKPEMPIKLKLPVQKTNTQAAKFIKNTDTRVTLPSPKHVESLVQKETWNESQNPIELTLLKEPKQSEVNEGIVLASQLPERKMKTEVNEVNPNLAQTGDTYLATNKKSDIDSFTSSGPNQETPEKGGPYQTNIDRNGKDIETKVSSTPVLIYTPPFFYPSVAKRNNWEGKVKIEILLNSNGKVAKATVISSSGYKILDDAAKKLVEKRRYQPVLQNGLPVEFLFPITFTWRLIDETH